jgi:hypothetical protein
MVEKLVAGLGFANLRLSTTVLWAITTTLNPFHPLFIYEYNSNTFAD